MNPWPLIREEKLETQKGMRKRRKTCHRSRTAGFPGAAMLNIKAIPMMRLIPREVAQMRGDGSK